MTKLDIRGIINKYLHQRATAEEISILYEWVKKKGNQDAFKKLVQAHFFVNHQAKSWDSEEAFNDFLKSIEGKREHAVMPLSSKRYLWRYAATMLILVACASYYLIDSETKTSNGVSLDTDQIILKLGNGEMMNLNPANDTVLLGSAAKIQLNNGVLRHNTLSDKKLPTTYNILKIPYGKRLAVTLEDGSTIRLNSGSELIYPSSFSGMETRQVSLKGEAFFEIEKDPLKPFIVKTEGMDTRVFGTVFNISSYEDDAFAEVVLVEGSVGIGDKDGAKNENLKMLEPSQKLTKTKEGLSSFVIENVDVTPYISWTKGIVTFENEPMSEIIKRLERQFNVDIENESNALQQLRFTGTFDKEGIDFILKTIQTHTHFEYTINEKVITIIK